MARRVQANPRDRVETGSWRSVARPVDWPARVQRVKARDKVCQWVEQGQLCGSTENPEVDHIGAADDHSLDNLRLLCRTHHRKRTGQQGGQAAQAKRIPRNRPQEKHPGLIT